MKIQKGAGEAGLVAELLKNSPDNFQADLLHLFFFFFRSFFSQQVSRG